jgi:hypothetical protein
MRPIIAASALLLAIGCDRGSIPSKVPQSSAPDMAGKVDEKSAKDSAVSPVSPEITAEDEGDPLVERIPMPAGPARLAPSEEKLGKFGEPVLKGPVAEGDGEMRFIYIPTFQKPFSVRVTKTGDEVLLRVVRMSGNGGYDWKEVVVRKTIPLTLAQWQELNRLAAVEGAREPSQLAMSGLDGTTWFLEVRDGKSYTVEGVPNPEMDEEHAKKCKEEMNLDFRPFLAVCLKLFEFSGLDDGPLIDSEAGKNPFGD